MLSQLKLTDATKHFNRSELRRIVKAGAGMEASSDATRLQVSDFIEDGLCTCCRRKRDQCSRRAKEQAWADELADAVRAQPRQSTCWGCDMVTEASNLKVCSRCLDEKLVHPASFCSEACLRANWKRHREWHKQWHPKLDTIETFKAACRKDPSVHSAADDDRSEYIELSDFDLCFREGMRLQHSGEHAQAVGVLKRAMQLNPDDHRPYEECAMAYAAQGKFRSAAPKALQSLARCSSQHWDLQGTELGHGDRMWQGNWALIFSLCFDLLTEADCAALPRPSWWNDAELKAVSSKAVALLPLQGFHRDMASNILMCRAQILAGPLLATTQPQCDWTINSRTPDEWREAGTCYAKAAKIQIARSRDQEICEELRALAAACYHRAHADTGAPAVDMEARAVSYGANSFTHTLRFHVSRPQTSRAAAPDVYVS